MSGFSWGLALARKVSVTTGLPIKNVCTAFQICLFKWGFRQNNIKHRSELFVWVCVCEFLYLIGFMFICLGNYQVRTTKGERNQQSREELLVLYPILTSSTNIPSSSSTILLGKGSKKKRTTFHLGLGEICSAFFACFYYIWQTMKHILVIFSMFQAY